MAKQKHTYTATINGQTFTRTSARTYRYAVAYVNKETGEVHAPKMGMYNKPAIMFTSSATAKPYHKPFLIWDKETRDYVRFKQGREELKRRMAETEATKAKWEIVRVDID